MDDRKPVQPSAIQLALAVRRGQLVLSDVPEAERKLVATLAVHLSDAQVQTLICANDRKTKQLGRSTVRTRGALS